MNEKMDVSKLISLIFSDSIISPLDHKGKMQLCNIFTSLLMENINNPKGEWIILAILEAYPTLILGIKERVFTSIDNLSIIALSLLHHENKRIRIMTSILLKVVCATHPYYYSPILQLLIKEINN